MNNRRPIMVETALPLEQAQAVMLLIEGNDIENGAQEPDFADVLHDAYKTIADATLEAQGFKRAPETADI